MLKTRYLIRLDDACPTMDHKKWQQVENILDKFGVRPMVGVIPHNENPHEAIDEPNPDFWGKVHSWRDKKWSIAMHGYNHSYISNDGMKGLNPMWARSEFAGLPLVEQKKKIKRGVSIMRENDINPKYFFAPSHTFDSNTIRALEQESDIRIISDCVGCYPYKKGNFVFIPVLGGHCEKRYLPGLWTFCLHPNTMNDNNIRSLELFLEKEHSHFMSFGDINFETVKQKGLFSKILSFLYFSSRKLRHLQ